MFARWRFGRHLFALTTSGAVAATISACSLAPERSAHPAASAGIDLPTQYQQLPVLPGQPANQSQLVYLSPTWLHEPVLGPLIERLLQANLDLISARMRVRQAQAQVRMSRASLWPSLALNASVARQRLASSQVQSASLGTSTAPLYQTVHELGLSTQWELDLFGGQAAATRQLAAQLAATELQQAALQQSLVVNLARQYRIWQHINARIAAVRDTIDNRQRALTATERRYRLGVSSSGGLDVRLARENLAAAQAQLPPLASAWYGARYAIAILLGEAPTAPLAGLPTKLPEAGLAANVAVPPLPPAAAPAPPPLALLDRRPDLIAAEYRQLAASAGVDVAVAALYPGFSLSGSYGYSERGQEQLITPENLAWNLLGNLTAPLFQGGRLRANVTRQRALLEEQAATYAAAILQAVLEVELAAKQETDQRQRMQALGGAVAEAEAALSLAQSRYQQGLLPFATVLDTERRLLQYRLQWLESRESVWLAHLDLQLALGGQWPLVAEEHSVEGPSLEGKRHHE